MRIGCPGMFLLALAACEPAPIGSYPETDDIQLPNRQPADEDDEATPAGESDGSRSSNSATLTVTIAGSGTGAVTSTPAGLTCSGTTCSGTFAKGTAVTLTAAPAAGSVFASWGGACAGNTACAPVLDADLAVTLNLESIAGTWSGTYTNTRQAFGCTFNNAGNLSITVAADGTALATTGSIDGLELRQPANNCNLVGKTTGSAPKETVTLDGAKATGTWTFNVQVGGTLAFPYTGTFAGNKLSGSWTCDTCVGSFTLTKQ